MGRSGTKMNKANRKATKGKGKMWKKGHSSSFNPECNKFRQAAKRRAVFGNPGAGNLTESALAQHNKLSFENQSETEDTGSVGGETAMTTFTNCSLPTFNRLLKNWNSSSFLHKEMIAVLAAVTDVLKANGGKETETEYFAALMTTLDVVDTDEGVTAVMCLLAMVVKRLDESVLKLNSKVTCEACSKLLIKYMNSDHCALLRNLLTVISTFLKVKSHWNESLDELKIILEFTTHHKPKVRRMAHHVTRAIIVNHIPENLTVHPASTYVANFCIEKLESNAGKGSDSRNVFYTLALLEDIMGAFPKQSVKKSCETIFKVMTLSSSLLTSNCLKTLNGLFALKPKPENLSSDLNARIITALYDFQPNVKDSLSLIYWLKLMEVAFLNLFSLDEKLCISHMPKFFSVAVKCLLSEKEDVMFAVSSSLTILLEKCISPSSEIFQQFLFEDPINNPMHKMFRFAEGALIYQYHLAWKYVLNVIAKFFEVMGKHCYTVMKKCLASLADLHDSYKFQCISEIERAVGLAIKHMGPKIVLEAIPLQIEAESEHADFPRSWMLPLLRDYIRNTELDFFVKYFLPLAGKMQNKSLVLQQEGKIIESKVYGVICSQIWSLLPGFCSEPTDLKKCFKEVARTLGIMLKDDPSLRLTVLSALRLLIIKNMENDENRKEIASFAKNYLPILFNLYTTEAKEKSEDKVRLAVYDTCKVFLQIADNQLCAVFFDRAMEKLSQSEVEIFMQHALIDLCKALLPLIDEERIMKLYEFCKPLLKHSNQTIQKKSFGVLKEICTSNTDTTTSFVNNHISDLKTLLSGSSSGLNPATKALRISCLQYIVTQLTEAQKSSLEEIIREAILCTKENSVKARTAAYNLLVEIGHKFKQLVSGDPKEALKEYMQVLLAGLSGNPHEMSATVLAIGRVVFEFKEDMDSQLINLLIENMCLLLSSQCREIVLSAMSFMKILFVTVESNILLQHVESLVKSISCIKEDNQRHFRFKAKELFTRLIRKFGYEMISKMVPDNIKKQLTNIRKTEARKHRKNDFVSDANNSEFLPPSKNSNSFEDVLADSDDDLQEDPRKHQVKRRPEKRTTCIEENDEDDIVDFLDPAVNKRLLSSQSNKEISKAQQIEKFPIAEDGRIIIEDKDDAKSKKEEKDLRAEVLSELRVPSKKNKRKLEDSDDEDATAGLEGVRKGIFRNAASAPKKRRPGSEFKAKKAGGDIKKGKVDPYAYVPLNRQALNKRKQVKLKGQYKTIVRAAKKGASIGTKRKARLSKKKRNMLQ